MTWRVTVLPLRPAVRVTRPPALPVGAKMAVDEGPAGMVATLPRSTPQPTLMAFPFSVALYVTVGVVWPAETVIVCIALGSTSSPWVLMPPVLPEVVSEMPPVPVAPLCFPPVPLLPLCVPVPLAVLVCSPPVPPVEVLAVPPVALPPPPQAAIPTATASERKSAEPKRAFEEAIREMYRATALRRKGR